MEGCSTLSWPPHAFGLERLAAADIRVSEQAVTFALLEAGIATCPGWSGIQRLVKLIGPSQVKLMALRVTSPLVEVREAISAKGIERLLPLHLLWG